MWVYTSHSITPLLPSVFSGPSRKESCVRCMWGVYLSFNYTSSSFCFFWSQSKRELCQMYVGGIHVPLIQLHLFFLLFFSGPSQKESCVRCMWGVYLSFNYTSSSFCFFWSQSKRELCQMLDDYIDLRVRRADDEISALCQKIIKNKDVVILVYA